VTIPDFRYEHSIPSASATRPTSSTVSFIAIRIACIASRPNSRAKRA
jgi:hypothetical protein